MKNDPEAMVLDAEEQDYEDNAESFISTAPDLREKIIQAAKATSTKTERMNIRLSRMDLENLKLTAAREGLPYQSLVTSILHKYTAGLLVDIREAKKLISP